MNLGGEAYGQKEIKVAGITITGEPITGKTDDPCAFARNWFAFVANPLNPNKGLDNFWSEIVWIKRGLLAIVDENGLINGWPQNPYCPRFYGPVLFVGELDDLSLTDVPNNVEQRVLQKRRVV